jgi:hypothetical protein
MSAMTERQNNSTLPIPRGFAGVNIALEHQSSIGRCDVSFLTPYKLPDWLSHLMQKS